MTPPPPLSFPARAGSYVLVLELATPKKILVGALGCVDFLPGFYAYAGSARGPGGLAARLGRHWKNTGKTRWHVDYLREKARPVEAWYREGAEQVECGAAAVLGRLPGASIPAHGFGASDCKCPAHLVHFGALPDFSEFTARMKKSAGWKRLESDSL